MPLISHSVMMGEAYFSTRTFHQIHSCANGIVVDDLCLRAGVDAVGGHRGWRINREWLFTKINRGGDRAEGLQRYTDTIRKRYGRPQLNLVQGVLVNVRWR